MTTQFIREESFSNKGGSPGRKGNKTGKGKSSKSRRYSAREILAELNRVRANCKHVPNPQAPVYIAGSTKNVINAVACPKRWDTRVVLGVVASWPERWDQCDPAAVAEWAVEVRKYAEKLWCSKVAAIVMHVDEAHPHIHIILHDCGKSVKPFSPGFAAGDSAYDGALAAGVARIDANRIRHAEYKRAQSAWLDHYQEHVGKRFGMARVGFEPRPRGTRLSALEARAEREWDDPVDIPQAAANTELVCKLLAGELNRPLPQPGGRSVDVLSSIGFVAAVDYADLARRLRDGEIAMKLHSAAVPLQRALLDILALKPDWIQFAQACHAREIDLMFRWEGEKVVGVTFRQGGRAFPGSKLGRRFSWPVLSRQLSFDAAQEAHISVLTEMDLRANSTCCTLELLDTDRVDASTSIKKIQDPKLAPLTARDAPDGMAYCWSSGRPALKIRKRSVMIFDPAPDVVAFAIAMAVKRGWKSLRLRAPTRFLKHCAALAIEVARNLGINLVVARERLLRQGIESRAGSGEGTTEPSSVAVTPSSSPADPALPLELPEEQSKVTRRPRR